MRPFGRAAFGEVGLLVHMESVLGARLAEVLYVPGDGDGVGVGLLGSVPSHDLPLDQTTLVAFKGMEAMVWPFMC